MTNNFGKMTILGLMKYLEELDYEASIKNKSTTELLEKARLDNKIPKDIFIILNNTLQDMKIGEIKCNKTEIKPYEKIKEIDNSVSFAIDIDKAVKFKSAKDVGKYFDNLEDWEITSVGVYGANIISSGSNGDNFFYDVKSGKLSLKGSDNNIIDSWIYGKDFTHIVREYERGIYLFVKKDNTLNGVTVLRWEKE